MKAATEPNPPLKIGLLLDETSIPAWAYTMLERILAEGHAEIELVIINATSSQRVPRTLSDKR